MCLKIITTEAVVNIWYKVNIGSITKKLKLYIVTNSLILSQEISLRKTWNINANQDSIIENSWSLKDNNS